MIKDGILKEEVLTFSTEQHHLSQMDESGLLKRKFYEGIEFTDRRDVGSEQSPFKDADIVYKGVVDESKISYKDTKTL